MAEKEFGRDALDDSIKQWNSVAQTHLKKMGGMKKDGN